MPDSLFFYILSFSDPHPLTLVPAARLNAREGELLYPYPPWPEASRWTITTE